MQNSVSSTTTQKKKIGIQDFQIKRILGKGAYGDVFLVQKDNQFYAMKQIVKRKLHKQKKQYQAMVQRQLLRCMKHVGIIKLRYAFQDKSKLYFVMEYCELGQFTRFMKQYVQFFTEQVRRFYIAQIINLLQYLHSNGIAHRDLKPQNILLSKYGHLKLVDFGTSEISQCKILSNQFKEQIQKQKNKEQQIQGEDTLVEETIQQPEEAVSPRKRRSTFVGTSYYISPQLLQENICEPPSDLWALGCIIYQLYYLETPFKDTTEYGIFQKIKKVQLQFPKNDLISQQAIDLIKKLLIKNPQERLGSGFTQELSYKKLKSHPYFKEINIDTVYSSIPPDINAKKFTMLPQQIKKAERQDFKQFALKTLQMDQKNVVQNANQVLIQGLIQKRQFPYYEWCYIRIYKTGKIKLIKIDRPQVVQVQQLFKSKTQQKYQIAKMVQNQALKFVLELKDRNLQVFRSSDAQNWVSVINTIKPSN